jgi:hypothetical protein
MENAMFDPRVSEGFMTFSMSVTRDAEEVRMCHWKEDVAEEINRKPHY